MKKLLTGAILLMGSVSYAQQDSTKKNNITFTGSVDAYYRYNFHNAKDQKATNNYTSFTNSQNSFELGMASLKTEGSTGKVTGVVDLGFGTRAKEFSYNDSGALTAIKQAYVTVAASSKIKLTMGKWATHIGYELVDAYLNRNYSMSYMFSYGPFFHTGIKADVTLGNIGFMVGVANPTDHLSASFASKFVLGQVSAATTNGKLKGYLNYQGGKDLGKNTINQVDLVVNGLISDKFNIGANGTWQSVKPESMRAESWWASALYLNCDPSKVFGLTLRGEYFNDTKGVSGLSGSSAADIATSVFEATLSGNIRIDDLTIIPEFRLDNARDAIFTKNSGERVKSTSSLILAATYHF